MLSLRIETQLNTDTAGQMYFLWERKMKNMHKVDHSKSSFFGSAKETLSQECFLGN